MDEGTMLITTGNLTPQSLNGQVAVITGAGGGIGYETARSLLWLGTKVVIAEIDRKSGKEAERRLSQEFDSQDVYFVQADVADERSVSHLRRQAEARFGKVDVVINNATLAPLGAVWETSIRDWDSSYRVNLRGPVLLAQAFIPAMLERDSGVFMSVSSLGTAYMGAYEAVKAAQVHLANTLDAELQGSNVSAFTIGPGFVPTRTAMDAIPRLAKLMGKSAEEVFAIVNQYTISVEAAGAGFAAAAAMAQRYRGQEISSSQALIDAGISLSTVDQAPDKLSLNVEQLDRALELSRGVRATLAEQSAGWKDRSIFEQQWLIRTFRSRAGMPVEQWLETLGRLEACLQAQDLAAVAEIHAPLDRLANYYAYLYETAKGYTKDPVERQKQLAIIEGWQQDVEQLDTILH